MQWLIKLYTIDPVLAFHSEAAETSLCDSLQLMTGVVSLVQHQAPPGLPLNASNLLLLP